MAFTSRVNAVRGAVIDGGVYGRASAGRPRREPGEAPAPGKSRVDRPIHSFYISPIDEVLGKPPGRSPRMTRKVPTAGSMAPAFVVAARALSGTPGATDSGRGLRFHRK